MKETWIDACLQHQSYLDETPYLIQPITANSFDIDVVPAIGCAIEWERDIQESVNKVYNNYPLFFKVVIIFYYNL